MKSEGANKITCANKGWAKSRPASVDPGGGYVAGLTLQMRGGRLLWSNTVWAFSRRSLRDR
eukprot:3830866-Lingulodinium_polyedra.AAC.1